MSKPYALYARISTKDGKQNISNQVFQLTEYAKSKGWDYEVFKEQESTRKTRPIKADLLQRLRTGEYQGIVITKLDRYARSVVELVRESEELINKGIEFHSIGDNIDFSTPVGKLQFHLLSAISEFERELIRERVVNALAQKKKNGVQLGRPKGSKDKKKRKTDGYYNRKSNNTPLKKSVLVEESKLEPE